MNVKVEKNTLYTVFLDIITIMYMFESSAISDFRHSVVQRAMLIVALIFAGLYIIMCNHTQKKIALIIMTNLVGALCYFSSGYTGLLLTMLAITLMPNDSLDKNLRSIFFVETVSFLTIVFLSQFGIIENITANINKFSYTAVTQAFGFGHSNMFAAQATSLVFLFLCVNRKRLNEFKLLFALVAIGIIFIISGGRTALILGLMGVLLISVRKKNNMQKIVFKILPFAQIIICGILLFSILIYIRLGYENAVAGFINDKLFNGRIGLSLTALSTYPITLFGKPLDMTIWNEYQFFSLDNGQVMLILNYGIIGALFYCFVIQNTLKNIKEEKEYVLAIVMMIFLIWTLMEGTMYFVGKNFALLFMGRMTATEIKNKRKIRFCI